MSKVTKTPGCHMAAELAQSLPVFCAAAEQSVPYIALDDVTAIYTIARGSSDAVANILSYEFMRVLGRPMTSLPPSIFSLGSGVGLQDTLCMIVSQSGASDDLVRSAQGATRKGARVVAITNQSDSPVEAAAQVTLSALAGEELAVPATKTVIGSIAAGIAFLRSQSSGYDRQIIQSLDVLTNLVEPKLEQHERIRAALLRARHVYVIGRDTGYGAAIETALKIKETCALHAEAYSASEVLHGPLQLATNPLFVMILDTGQTETQPSLDQAERRFLEVGCEVIRIRVADVVHGAVAPAVAAAILLRSVYPLILEAALALGFDPDVPKTLAKVTQTT